MVAFNRSDSLASQLEGIKDGYFRNTGVVPIFDPSQIITPSRWNRYMIA